MLRRQSRLRRRLGCREQLADIGGRARVRCHVRALHLHERRLAHVHHPVEARRTAHLAALRRAVAARDELEHERRLARSRRARDGGQATGGDAHVDVLEVEQARAAHLHGGAVGGAERLLGRGTLPQPAARGRHGLGGDLRERADGDDAPAMRPRPRPHVDDEVGCAHDVGVVLDDQHGVAQVAQFFQHGHEALGVARVQASGGLVQDVDDAGQLRVQHAGQAHALQLAARQRDGLAVEREVAQPHLQVAGELRLQVAQVVARMRALLARERRIEVAYPREHTIERQGGQFRQPRAAHRGRAPELAQTLAAARGARRGDEVTLKALRGALALGVAPPQKRQDALELPRRHGLRLSDLGKRRRHDRAGRAVQQDLPLQRAEALHRHARGNVQAVVPVRRVQRLDHVILVPLHPEVHRAVFERTALVERRRQVDGERRAQPLARGARTLLRVERELRARELRHPAAACAAPHEHEEVAAVLLGLLLARVRADGDAAMRARAHVQLLEHHAQVGVRDGHGTHRGARVAVGVRLRHEDGGRRARDAVDLRLANALEPQRLEVLALAFVEQHVHEQRRLARPRQPGERDEPALRNVERDALEVAFARVQDADVRHKAPFPVRFSKTHHCRLSNYRSNLPSVNC